MTKRFLPLFICLATLTLAPSASAESALIRHELQD
jgi:hypothetical protein